MERQLLKNTGVGLAIGMGVGGALGAALGNMVFGLAFGVAFGGIFRKKEDIHLSSATRRIIFTLLSVGILAALTILGYALFTWQ